MIRFHEGLSDLMVPKNTLVPHEENDNNGDIDEIVQSILVNGCYRPIIASTRSHRILAGHHLYAALLELGAEMVPVTWADVDEATERRILFADNHIARLARTEDARTLALLEKIKDSEPDLRGTGADERYLDALRAKVLKDEETPLKINLSGSENLIHTITCPNCQYEWVRGSSPTDD